MALLLPRNFIQSEVSICNLQRPDLLRDRVDSWVVKRATTLFNSFNSNVAKEDARFCCQYYRNLTLPFVFV